MAGVDFTDNVCPFNGHMQHREHDGQIPCVACALDILHMDIISLRKGKEFLRLSLESAARQVKEAQLAAENEKRRASLLEDLLRKVPDHPRCAVCGKDGILIYMSKTDYDCDEERYVTVFTEYVCFDCVNWFAEVLTEPKQKHVCKISRSCSCSGQALEPDDNCPVHGYPYPPRCGECGRFVKRSTV